MTRLAIGFAVAFALVGCGGGGDSTSGTGSNPSPVPTSTWVEYDGGPVDPYDAGTKPPPACTPLTVRCPSSQREVCSGDGQWATLSDLPMCSTVCEAPVGRFLVSVDDNTTTDTTTGLTWMWRAGQGPATCASYGAGDRYPSESEMIGIAAGAGCTPNVDQAAFADQPQYYFIVDQGLCSNDLGGLRSYIYDANAQSVLCDSNKATTAPPYGSEVFSRCVR